MKPTISVITVTYNALEDLKKTLESIDHQQYTDMECIVVDGGSYDGTVAFLQSFQSHHPMKWISEPDKGIYDAMNKGMKMATGNYCIYMNAADTFVSDQTLTDVATQGMTADVVYGDILKQGKLKESLSPRNCHKMYYCHQSAFTRTECLQQFPFDIQHKMSADFKQSKQLFLAGKTFQHIPVIVCNYDTNGISNRKRSDGLMDNIKVIHEVDNFKEQIRLLPRLYFTYLLCLLRGK